MHEKPIYLILAENRCLYPDRKCNNCRDRLHCYATARAAYDILTRDFTFTPKTKIIKQGYYPHTLSAKHYLFFVNKLALSICDHIKKDCKTCSSREYCTNLSAKAAASINFDYEIFIGGTEPERRPISNNTERSGE